MFKVPEDNRVEHPLFGMGEGCNGLFFVKIGPVVARCLASDGGGWEHVSVSLSVKRIPDWDEMCFVKDLFWDKEDAVMQFHPPEADYVNNHAYCLHLWRKCGVNPEMPPSIFVGDKSLGLLVK